MKRAAAVLFILGAVFLIVPPVVANLVVEDHSTTYTEVDPVSGEVIEVVHVGPMFPGDPESWEGFAAAMYVAACWLIAVVLVIVGFIVLSVGIRRDGMRRSAVTRTREDDLWTLGHDVDGQWTCFDHDVVECPVCLARVRPLDSKHEIPAGRS